MRWTPRRCATPPPDRDRIGAVPIDLRAKPAISTRRKSGFARAGLALAVLASVGLHSLFPLALRRFASQPVVVVAGASYRVAAVEERATFDLEFVDGDRYLLIVGSLGSHDQTHHVRIDSQATESIAATPFECIEPLVPRSILTCNGRSGTTTHETNFQPNSVTLPLAERSFHIHVTDGPLTDPRHYAEVTSVCVGHGPRVAVYLDGQIEQRQLASGLVDEIVRLMNDDLVPAFDLKWGAARDVDGDGRFTVLLSPWLDRLLGGKTSLGGFVRGDDFRDGLAAPFSNGCDMLYLNSNLRPDAHLRTLLAHEFAHAVCLSRRLPTRDGGPLPVEEDWLNEALAHVAENEFGGTWRNLDHRISRFLSAPEEASLVVPDYYQAGLWRNHGCRGATYLFLRWCVDTFGDDLPARLAGGPYAGVENLKWATGTTFDELFRRWTLAVGRSGRIPDSQGESGFARSTTTATGVNAYRSLNLRGRLAKWGLAGPRVRCIDLTAGTASIELKGSTAAFVELHADGDRSPRRIRVVAEPGANIQLTLVRRKRNAPRVRAKAGFEGGPETPNGADPLRLDSARRLFVDVEIEAHSLDDGPGAGCCVELIAVEQNSGDSRNTRCFAGDDLDARRDDVAVRRASDRTPVRPRRASFRYLLPSPGRTSCDAPIMVKVVVRNAAGLSGCAHLVVAPPHKSRRHVRVAARKERL